MEIFHLTLSQGINIFTFGQILLMVSLCLSHSQRHVSHLVLATILSVFGLLILRPVVEAFLPSLELFALLIMLPALLAVGPLIWLYIESLTTQTPWKLTPKHTKHFLLVLAGAICALLTGLLPDETKVPLLTAGDIQGNAYVGGLMLMVFLLIIGWTLQSGYYLWRIVTKLTLYRKQLKEQFANNEDRELHWISAMVIFLGIAWLIAVASVLFENLTDINLADRVTGALLILGSVWVFSLFGLRQSPGFAGRYLVENNSQKRESDNGPDKYQRSALSDEQATRIAAKIDALMKEQQLYLDPQISLRKLSGALGTSPNYVSQTLNETLGCSFFDYINKWRIEAALPLVLANKKSVLDIAMAVGFNARSSFYTAFKQHVGMTPGEYRKHSPDLPKD